jgi:hypothetical protein
MNDDELAAFTLHSMQEHSWMDLYVDRGTDGPDGERTYAKTTIDGTTNMLKVAQDVRRALLADERA